MWHTLHALSLPPTHYTSRHDEMVTQNIARITALHLFISDYQQKLSMSVAMDDLFFDVSALKKSFLRFYHCWVRGDEGRADSQDWNGFQTPAVAIVVGEEGGGGGSIMLYSVLQDKPVGQITETCCQFGHCYLIMRTFAFDDMYCSLYTAVGQSNHVPQSFLWGHALRRKFRGSRSKPPTSNHSQLLWFCLR